MTQFADMLRQIYDSLPTTEDLMRRNAESMKLFERDGMIHYGKWRDWRRAAPEEAKRLLAEFREGQ